MIEVIEATAISVVLGLWVWTVLDIASRTRTSMPNRTRWLAGAVVGGPVVSVAYALVARRQLPPLPRVDHGTA